MLEAFEQRESLTTRLRNILKDYPEGAGVLHELLQNADDAGASDFCALLDEVTESLHRRSSISPQR